MDEHGTKQWSRSVIVHIYSLQEDSSVKWDFSDKNNGYNKTTRMHEHDDSSEINSTQAYHGNVDHD